MSDDSLIRLENLKSLKLTARELSEKVGGRISYWNDMLSGNKSFGEKIARKIEEKLGLPRGSLDLVDGEAVIAQAAIKPPASPEAMMLAHLFDELPADDLIARATAHNAASAAILKVLNDRQVRTSGEQSQAVKLKRQRV
jgi:hypothetical protein